MAQDAEFFYRRYEENRKSGKFEDALHDLGQAIALEPTDSELYLIRGRWLCRRDEHDAAIADLTRVVELSSDLGELAEAHNLRAISYENVGNYLSLIKDLTWLIENELADFGVYMWRGYHNYRAGNYTQSASDFTAALKLRPDVNRAFLQRAQAYYQSQRYNEALDDLSHILGSEGEHPSFLRAVYHWRGRIYYDLNKNKEALADFNEVMLLTGGEPFSDASDYMKVYGPPD